jgi:ribosome-binding factor A
MNQRGSGSRKVKQVAGELSRAMQELLARRLNDPRLSGMITITHVDVSPDLKHAVLSVSVLPEKNEPKVLAGLKHATAHLRHQLGELLDSHRIPALDFKIDKGLKNQAAVMAALGKARLEAESAPGAAGGGTLDAAGRAENNRPDQAPPGAGQEPAR